MSARGWPRAVLFDLDGTLLDTAPDMVPVLNQLRAEEQVPPLPYERARAHVSHGVLGLLRLSFGDDLAPGRRDRLRERFLALYSTRLADATCLFPGMAELLERLEAMQIAWGVVTNKPAALTEPLLEQMRLRHRCACVVSGDTTPERKPHPAPLRHALGEINVVAPEAIYVGDAQRDIDAGRAAGMRTVVALYGYIPPEEKPDAWGADHRISEPLRLLDVISSPRGMGATP